MVSRGLYYFFIMLLLTLGCTKEKSVKKSGVFVQKENGTYTLYKDQQPFMMKGAAGEGNYSLLKALGGNTIRIYDTLNLQAVLDSAMANELLVIADLPIASSKYHDSFYKDEVKIKAQYQSCRSTILKYKDHPSLLMWCLGNEVVFPTGIKFNSFYRAYNDLLDMIHNSDPKHPVTTTLKNLNARSVFNIKLRVNDLDLIGINTFGQIASLKEDLDKIKYIWDGPYFVSEWGVNGYWEESYTAWDVPVEPSGFFKNQRIRDIDKQFMPYKDPRFLGSVVFFWGNKQERTHTWYSLFDEARHKSSLTEVLSEIWQGNEIGNTHGEIKGMILNGKSAYDNIILEPGTINYSEYFPDINSYHPVQVVWQIKPEDWYSNWNGIKAIPEVSNLIFSQNGQRVSFKAPIKSGPYRLFVKAVDSSGTFSQANIPFYVIR